MKERKRILGKSLILIMALSMVIGMTAAAIFGAAASASSTNENPVSVFDDGYELKANWI